MNNRIELWNNVAPYSDGGDGFVPYIEPYTLDTEIPAGAVIICPGGGYTCRAEHEGRPVAETFNKLGFHAFVLQYRVSPARHPAPLADVLRAVRIVRANAGKWMVEPEGIAVCGFSAGGHLACSAGVHCNQIKTAEDDLAGTVSAEPDAMILAYPVITSGEFGHKGSFVNLLGENAPEEMRNLMSLEKQVTENTPPAFLWHTADDCGVPVENSLLFAGALRNFRIPFELHVFPAGRHGLGLAQEAPNIAVWPELAAAWLRLTLLLTS